MTGRRALDAGLAVYLAVMALIFLPLGVFAGGDLSHELLGAHALLMIGAVAKLAALATGGVAAGRAAGRFDSGSAPRLAWRLVSAWLLLWLVAQTYYAVYQVILSVESPFPSIADAFFVAGYLSMIVGFVALLRAYVASGLPIGSRRGRRVLGATVAVGASVPSLAVMSPYLGGGGSALEVTLNLAYPVLDFVALVPAAILLRIAFRLLGGSVFWVWSLLIGGFVAMWVGDILYGYFSMLEQTSLESVIDFAYVLGYTLAARGVLQQLRVS